MSVTRHLHTSDSLYHMLFGIKFLLSLAVFALASMLTSGRAWSARIRASADQWSLVLLGLAIAVLSTLEISTHVRALRKGQTKNVSRLITCLLMLVVMLIMVGVNSMRWKAFIAELEAPYHDLITTSATK